MNEQPGSLMQLHPQRFHVGDAFVFHYVASAPTKTTI